jgi:lipopolysaccharide biosynthesis glycosyltransferase
MDGFQIGELEGGSQVEVLCACDELYLPHSATMLCSLLEHNDVSRIHLFYSSVPKQELEKLESFVRGYGSKITFYEMTLEDFKGLHIDKWASAAVYFRLLAPRLLPIDLNKILYLDTDIVVRGSLADLWNTDITGRALAAVPHNEDEDDFRKALGLPEGAPYLNSGVLLINLRFWRENKVVEHAISFIMDNPGKVQFWDQDALNATLIGQWVELPTIWNWRSWERPSKGEKDPVIVHFVGHHKPWQWANQHPFRREYRKYRQKTPWPYKEEGVPSLLRRFNHSLRIFARTILPDGLQRRLKSRNVTRA